MTNQQRRVCMMFTVCICFIYLGYRGLFTLSLATPFASVFSVTLYLAEIYGNLLMFLYFFQIWNPTVPDPVPPLPKAKVDAYIPTYNEEPELLRGTIVSALEMDYPHETYVLDDGNRPEVRELTEELGAKYISRDSNIHAKAGNLNHAMEITDGDFIIVFDSDHVAERNFITRTLGYFADDDLAFIQTPHSYYNFDSFQGSLNYDKRFYWEEGQLFYNIVQPGKNHWNAASFCGSAAIFRKSALESVGLIATESITEDMQTGLRLHSNGWKSLYINERLVSGLAAPDLETFSVQRLRWGEGNLGTIFYDNPVTMKGLSFPQRLNYLALMLSWTTGVQKLILYYTPLLMLLTGVGPVADMTWHLVLITVFYVFTVWYTVKASGNGYGRLIDTEITQMATFWTQCRGTWRALFNRKSANFVVTQKSGGGRESSIHDFLRPQYTFIGCSIVSITWAASRYVLGVSEDFLGLSICSLLVLVHCVFAWIVIRRALAQRRFDWRHPCAAHISYELETPDGTQRGEGITKDLCETGVGFLAYEKLNGHELKMTITAGDTSVTVRGKICNWDSIVDYQSRKEGKVGCYRYGVQFEGLGKQELRHIWHITTKYSVARRYVEFDPNVDSDVFDPVASAKDQRLSIPVRVYRPDVGDICSVTETMTNNEFTMLSSEDLRKKTHVRTTLSAPTGEITGNARLIKSAQVDLGQMPLFAYRYRVDSFDGQSRGKLTTLIHLSHNPKLSTVTTLRPMKTRMPLALPATIVGAIGAVAASLTILAALYFCHDQVLMARAALGKPLDDSGKSRLSRLVDEYERNPLLNERLFLRLREAMLAVQDEDAIARLNEALVTNEFRSPAAQLQQAYTLEELGLVEQARDAFDHLRQNLDDFKNRRTRANVILAAARNAVKRREYDEAERLYQEAWADGTTKSSIRVEYAGILASRQKFETANEILTSDELTLDDLYLQASLFAGMKRFDRARRIYRTLAMEFPNDIRARRGEADVEAWTENYDLAIATYRSVLEQWPDDLQAKISLTQTLAWNKDSREAIKAGLNLLPDAEGVHRLKIWTAILESMAEIKTISADDQVVIMKAFGERKNFAHDAYFLERLAACLISAFDADQAAPLVEQLVGMCSESKLLRTGYAQTLYKMGDFNEAAKHYEHLIANDSLPDDLKDRADILLAAAFNSAQRGATEEASERYNLAMNCYIRLIEQDQLETTYWLPFLNAVAGCQVHTKEVSLAVLEIFNARASIANDRESMLRLADALSKVDEDRLAIQVLDELTSQNEGIDTRWRRANVLMRLGKHEAADSIYEQLILDDVFAGQEESQVQLLLAAANNAHLLGREKRAHARFQRGLIRLRTKLKKHVIRTPLWTPFLSAISGMQRCSAEDLSLTMNIYRERARMAENFQFLDRLKDVLLIARLPEKTLPLFELLLDQKPQSRRLQLQYARSLQAAGSYEQAEDIFEHLAQKRTTADPAEDAPDYEVMLGAANNALALGRRPTASRLYRETVAALEPLIIRDFSDTRYWQAFLSALSGLNTVPAGNAEQVLEIYRNRDLYDEQVDFLANLGHVMVLMGEQRPAIDLLKQAIARFPDDKKLRQELAAAFSAIGDYEKANAYFRWVVDRTEALSDPLQESRLLMQAARNSQRLGAQQDYEAYSSRALQILTEQLNMNLNRITLWQPFLDAAAGSAVLSAETKDVVTALFKRWRQRSYDEAFLERLADVLVKTGDVRRAIILLEHQETQSPKTALRLAILLKEVGEYETAESRFRELLARKVFAAAESDQADLLLAAADNAFRMGDRELSRTRYQDVLQLLRGQAQVLENIELCTRYLDAVGGAPDISPEDIDNVLAIRRRWMTSKNPGLRSRLVDVMLRLERPDDALPILQTLVEEWPDSFAHQLRLAKTLQSLERFEEAGQLYARLIDGNTIGSNTDAYIDLYASAARNSLSEKAYEEARARFEILFQQPVHREHFRIEYALALENTGSRQLAVQLLEETPDLATEHRLLLASMYTSEKSYTKARLVYDQILESQPEDRKALRGLADVAFWSKDYETAVTVYRKLFQEYPNDLELHESLASSLLWGGNRRVALEEFTTLLQSDPRRHDLWIRYLEAVTAANRLTTQQQRLVSMIQSQLGTLPREQALSIRERLADAYAAHSQYAQSLEILEPLVVASPADTQLRAKLAMSLVGIGRVSEAVPMLVELVDRNPKATDLRTQLAQAYIAAKNDERANEEFSLLIKREQDRESLDFARLLLNAAGVSQRLQRQDESRKRFAAALDILAVMLQDNRDNVELWQPFLDAAAGTREFSAAVGRQALYIAEHRQQHIPTKEFLTRIADVMSILDRPRDVLPILKRLNQQYPDDGEIEGRLANTYLSLKNFDRALPLLRRLAKHEQPRWKWQTQLAAALHTSKEYKQAEDLYRQLLASPEYPEEFRATLLLGAARNSAAMKNFNLAQARFEQRRLLVATAETIDDEYAGVLLELGEPQRVVDLLADRVLTVSLQRVLAGAYEALGQRAAARDLFAQIVAQEPNNDPALRGLARIALADGDGELAITLYTQLLQTTPNDLHLQFDRGLAYLGEKRFQEAANTFAALLESESQLESNQIKLPKVQTSYLQALAGLEQLQPHHVESAQRIHEQLLSKVDVEMDIVVSLADVMLRADQVQFVLELTEPYVVAPDQSDEVAIRYAHGLLNCGRADEALGIYRSWLAREPENREAKYLLATALHLTGQYSLADSHFRVLLKEETPEGKWFLSASDTAQRLGQVEQAQQLARSATTIFLQRSATTSLTPTDSAQLLRAVTRSGDCRDEVRDAVLRVFQEVMRKTQRDEVVDGVLMVDLARTLQLHNRLEELNRVLDLLATRDAHPSRFAESYADLLMQLEAYRKANSLYTKLMRANPNSLRYPMQLARTHYHLAEYGEAASFFEQVFEDPQWTDDSYQNHIDFMLSAADNSRRLGRPYEAADRYHKAFERLRYELRRDFRNSTKWIDYLFAFVGTGSLTNEDLLEAEQLIRRIYVKRHVFVATNPDRKQDFLMALSNALQRCNAFQESQNLLQGLLEEEATNLSARTALAQNFAVQQRWEESAFHFEAVLKRDPTLPPARQANLWLAAAEVFRQVNRLHEARQLQRQALQSLREVLMLSTDHVDLWHSYLTAFNAVKESSTDDLNLVKSILDAHLDRQTSRQSLAGNVSTNHDNQPGYLLPLGEALSRIDAVDAAVSVFRSLGDQPPLYFRLGTLLARQGKFADALQYYEKVERAGILQASDSEYDDFQLAMALAEQRIGEVERARERFRSIANKYRATTHDDINVAHWKKYVQALRGLEKLEPSELVEYQFACGRLEAFQSEIGILEGICDLALKVEDTPQNALVVIDEVLAQVPESFGVRVAKVRALMDADQAEIADRMLTNLREELANYDPLNLDQALHEVNREWLQAARTGEILLLHGRVKSKLKLHTEALALFEASPQIADVDPLEYAAILAKADEIERALNVLERLPEPSAKVLTFQASLLIQQEEYEQAKTIITAVLEQNPEDPETQRLLANTLFWAREYDAAIGRYLELLQQFPEDRELRSSLGKSLLWVGRYDEAKSMLGKLVVEDPSDTSLWACALDAIAGSQRGALQNPALVLIKESYQQHPVEIQHAVVERLATISRRDGDPMLARSYLLPYIKTENTPRFLQAEYADVLSALKFHEQAIDIYERLLDVVGDDEEHLERVEIQLRFADVLHVAKEYEAAQIQLDELLLQIDNTSPARLRHALLSTARNLVALERHQKALGYFRQLRDMDPDKFELHEEYAGALLSASRPREALQWLTEAPGLTLDGEFLLGAIYTNLEAYRRAVGVYRSIVERHPKQLKAWRLLADNASWGKDFRTAIHIYEQLLLRAPDDESLRIALADAWLWSDKQQQALEVYFRILRQAPDRYDLWARFAQAATADVRTTPEMQSILESILAARDAWPREFNFRLSMVDALFRTGDDSAALKLLQELYAERPTDRKIRRRLADELHRLERYQQAEELYQGLLSPAGNEAATERTDQSEASQSFQTHLIRRESSRNVLRPATP